MEYYNFNWLNSSDDIVDTLANIAALPDELLPQNQVNTNNDTEASIIDYLLYSDQGTATGNNAATQPQQAEPKKSEKEKELYQAINDTMDNPDLPFNVIEKDNFVTFTPFVNATPKKQPSTKKNKSRGPIFVTASPQTFSKKLRKYPGNPQPNSSDENSDEDINDNPDTSSQMTSKEKRLHKNKISARNFRVRRKEYIKQLQDQVKDQAQKIQRLEQENEQLRKSNEELMKHVLTQPITSTSNQEPFASCCSSGSEENHSPEVPPLPVSVETQFSNLYDFNLFENMQSSQPHTTYPPFNINAPDLFYFNHVTVPDWDISRVFGEKGEILVSEQEQRQMSRDLLNDYPLLAPALMSIVLRHTLSMEYVASLANELKKDIHTSDNEKSYEDALPLDEDMEIIKASMNRLRIDGPEKADEGDSDELSLLNTCLSQHFSHYALHRAMGNTHDEAFKKFKDCVVAEKKKEHNKSKSLKTLQLYSRLAGDLLRNPQRMSRIRQVVRMRPEFKNRSQDEKESLIKDCPVASTSN